MKIETIEDAKKFALIIGSSYLEICEACNIDYDLTSLLKEQRDEDLEKEIHTLYTNSRNVGRENRARIAVKAKVKNTLMDAIFKNGNDLKVLELIYNRFYYSSILGRTNSKVLEERIEFLKMS